MKVSLKTIEDFLAPKKMAIAGVSRNKKKFGYNVFSDLTKLGYTIYPVNPNAEMIDETKCFPDVQSLPGDVENLLILTPKEKTDIVLEDAVKKGIRNIWIQQMSQTPKSFEIAKSANINLIANNCIFMFANPRGIHKFHASIKKLFGVYPK